MLESFPIHLFSSSVLAMHWLSWLPPAVCSAWALGGVAAVTRGTPRPRALDARPPAGSGLKQLCGTDPTLRSNLESFFRQDHPAFELLFGVVDARAPAIDVVRELEAKYPAV